MNSKQEEVQMIMSLLGMPDSKEKFYINPENTMGMVIGNHNLSLVSIAESIIISMDGGDSISFDKAKLMTCEHICADVQFYLDNGELEKAQLCLYCAEKMDASNQEEHWQIFYLKGCIALQHRKFRDCIDLLLKSISIGCPLLAQCYDSMSASAAIIGSKEEALQYYSLLTTVAADKARSWNCIGGFYWDNDFYQAAAQSYVKALQCDRKDFSTYEELMNLSEQLGYADISQQYETALRLHSEISQTVLQETEAWAATLPADHIQQ